MTDTTTEQAWPPPAPLKATARGHLPVWDPPAGLTKARRWTCPCGATALDYVGNVYGTATERDCTVTPPPADPPEITVGATVRVTTAWSGTWTGRVAEISGHLPRVTCTDQADSKVMWPGMTFPVAFGDLQLLEDGGPA